MTAREKSSRFQAMRNYVLAAIIGLAGLTVGAALVVVERHVTGDLPPAPPPTLPGEAAVALPPLLVPEAPPAAPPSLAAGAAPSPAQPAAPDTTAAATPTAGAPATAEATSPADAAAADASGADAQAAASGGGSDLPNVDIAKLPVHPVPSEEPTVPTVTLEDRNGKTLKQIQPEPPAPPPQVATAPTVTPGIVLPRNSGSRNAAAPALVPPVTLPQSSGPQPSTARSPATPATTTAPGGTFSGAAKATGATVLAVGGYSVRLFGVRPAEPRDQCSLGAGDNRSCIDVARDALAQRLQHYPNVSCHMPPGQRNNAAVCMDGSGTDLGGFLVAEGYALADTGQSFDYAGAEGAAHTFRRGLWKNR
jgi:endonuclease YncB( thermonuclease family)